MLQGHVNFKVWNSGLEGLFIQAMYCNPIKEDRRVHSLPLISNCTPEYTDQKLLMRLDCLDAEFINDFELGFRSMFKVLDRFWRSFDRCSGFVCIKSVYSR